MLDVRVSIQRRGGNSPFSADEFTGIFIFAMVAGPHQVLHVGLDAIE